MKKYPRILIVDDEDDVRSLLQELLVGMGYRCETASDGIEALAKLKLDIDLVLTDLVMTGMDGYEIARRIRSNSETSDLPIMMVTALDSKDDRLKAVVAGANDFIAKPLDKTELQIRINSLLRMKRAQDELKMQKTLLEETVEKKTAHLRQMINDLVNAHRSTQQAHMETIKRLAIAAEYKDANTGAHIQRMSEYSALLARGLRLEPREVELIGAAAPMHDIGKISVPDEVLLKPDKLTSEERRIIKAHPLIGEKLLGGSDNELLKTSEIIAVNHHEKWDGSGYPRGLQGEEIPLFGRICALADVFDALTSERPYKDKFSNRYAFSIILEESGKQFDPKLVDLFFEMKDEILEVQARYNNQQ